MQPVSRPLSSDMLIDFTGDDADESHNINCLILENRKRSADAIARLRKEATLRRAEVQQRRDIITQQWRDVHHRNELEVLLVDLSIQRIEYEAPFSICACRNLSLLY